MCHQSTPPCHETFDHLTGRWDIMIQLRKWKQQKTITTTHTHTNLQVWGYIIMLLLMEDILHHLECINDGINYQSQLVSRISEPARVCIYFFGKKVWISFKSPDVWKASPRPVERGISQPGSGCACSGTLLKISENVSNIRVSPPTSAKCHL